MSAISCIDVDSVKRSGLPGFVFDDPDVFRQERQSIFATGWVGIASGQQLPQPGDMLPVNIGGHALVVVRRRDHSLAVFHNVCRHKGAPLVDAPCNRGTLVCPYHRWTYGLDGELRGAPRYGGRDDAALSAADRAGKGLLPVRMALWWDTVFVNISGDAQDFDSFIAPLDVLLAGYDATAPRLISATDYSTGANWKLAVDNFLDGWHVPFVHSQACTLDSIIEQEDLFVSPDILGLRLANGASDKPAKTSQPLPHFADLPMSMRGAQQWFCIFPNTLFFVDPCWVQTIVVKPQSTLLSTETLTVYAAHPDAMADELAESRERLHGVLNEVNTQDVQLLDRIQVTRSSRAANEGNLVQAWDAVNTAFHTRWLHCMQR